MKSHFSKKDRNEIVTGLFMILPAIGLLGVFVIVPLIMAIYRSFFDYVAGQDSVFVGWQNYVVMVQNENFRKSILNVITFSALITVIQVTISFFFANILTRVKGKLGVFCRTIIYLPYLLSGIVVAVIFTLLTTYNGGIINSIVEGLGGDPIAFMNDVFWSPASIIVPTIWIGFGYYTLVMYSGLINIPKDYFEAAAIDGAGFFQTIRYVTIPCMKNYFVLLIVTLIVVNLQMFEIPMIMTNGQPANQTMTPVLYLIHSRANGNISDSEITAASLLIMLIILVINSTVFYLFRTPKNREWEV
jgi:ABC-type sugar transport system permease subunit